MGSVKSNISETKCIAPLLRLMELRLVSKIWSAGWKKKTTTRPKAGCLYMLEYSHKLTVILHLSRKVNRRQVWTVEPNIVLAVK
mgnify:CR=1 FL=1